MINPTDNTYDDILSSDRELRSRGATIIGISDKSDEAYDHFIRLPNLVSILYPLIEIIPLQLLAYYLALRKNIDPDYPRNLAKSVTVSSVGVDGVAKRKPNCSSSEYLLPLT